MDFPSEEIDIVQLFLGQIQGTSGERKEIQNYLENNEEYINKSLSYSIVSHREHNFIDYKNSYFLNFNAKFNSFN